MTCLYENIVKRRFRDTVFCLAKSGFHLGRAVVTFYFRNGAQYLLKLFQTEHIRTINTEGHRAVTAY
jgi:hypothetical protein